MSFNVSHHSEKNSRILKFSKEPKIGTKKKISGRDEYEKRKISSARNNKKRVNKKERYLMNTKIQNLYNKKKKGKKIKEKQVDEEEETIFREIQLSPLSPMSPLHRIIEPVISARSSRLSL